jgi:hypothetical protein
LRPPDSWAEVALLIRQTARYPIAAPSDGLAFRNSVLAGFENRRWSRWLLLALLNSSLLRWAHYWMHRDARQGMPQLKVGHLRALPAMPEGPPDLRPQLEALARAAASSAEALDAPARQRLDELVSRGYGLSDDERGRVAAWQRENPLPTPRRRSRSPA